MFAASYLGQDVYLVKRPLQVPVGRSRLRSVVVSRGFQILPQAAQGDMGLDSRSNVFSIEGLGDKSDCAADQCFCLIEGTVDRTDEDHRNRSRGWVVLQSRAYLLA